MFPVLLGLAAATCWSIHDMFTGRMTRLLGPVATAFVVMLAGAFLLLPIVLWRGHIWQADLAGTMQALALGVAYALGMAALFKAFHLAPVSVVGPLTAGYPALVVIWGVVHGLQPTALQWAAVAVTIAGAVIVGRLAHQEDEGATLDPARMPEVALASVIASVGFAAAVILGQDAAVALGEYEATFVSRFSAALCLLPFLETKLGALRRVTRLPWGIFIMAAMDVAALTMINAAGHLPGKEYAAMGISAYGAIAVVLAMVFLGERVARGQWLGIAMIVSGVTVLALP
ncbi:MAG TPA: DMT family transporter [Aestuariivirga sp.]|nr:DMT family transporter [Aestuariivirga sp.]